MDRKVYSWAELKDAFTEGLVLGNGASIAFDTRFNYGSLRQSACDMDLFDADVEQVFEHLGTSDFELVLRMLWHASKINEALAIEEQRTPEAYANVRDALIKVIQAVHVAHGDVADRIPLASSFLLHFKTVASLSYDLLVYWAVMEYNAQVQHRLKDCFLGGKFERDWKWLRTPYGLNEKATIVVYPHGSLAIGADLSGGEFKIPTMPDGDLLSSIFEAWRSGEVTPVFVSEGTSVQKLAAIRRSAYLSTVYDEMLPDMGASVVLFGWSMGVNDQHLVDAICRGTVRHFAVAVDPADPGLEEFQAYAYRLISDRRHGMGFGVFFFDRGSAGAWVAP